jgi:hypothetical protein
VCAPLAYGPGPGVPDGLHRYWLWDFMPNTGVHPLSLLPQQIVELKGLGEVFDPGQFAVPLSPAAPKNPGPLPTVAVPLHRPGAKP